MKHILAISMECWNVNLFVGNSKQNLILTKIGKCTMKQIVKCNVQIFLGYIRPQIRIKVIAEVGSFSLGTEKLG